MDKPGKIIFLIMVWSLYVTNAFSQYYVKIKGDSIAFKIDSVIMAADNQPGSVNWEVSKDSLSWKSLNETNDTLVIRIDSSAYYRAFLTSETCNYTISDVALVSFKSINVTGNSVTLDSSGCVYLLPSGIKIIVPAGAVKENTILSFDLLDSINADLKIPFKDGPGKIFCTGLFSNSAAISFLKPIRIRIPAPNYKHYDLPYVYLYNSNNGLWEKYTGDLTCSEYLHFIEFSTNELVSARVHLFENLFLMGKSAGSAKQDVNKDCKEGFIHVESMAHDQQGQQGSNECFVSSDHTTVTFLSCPGSPTAEARIQEIGKDCTPEAEDDMNKIKCLKNGESATITISVTIGGMPLKDQEIIFYSIPAGISVSPTSKPTDDNGKAQFVITCHIEKFSGIIKYKVNCKYFLQVIQASDGGVSENSQIHEQTLTISNGSGKQINECAEIKYVEPSGGGLRLRAGETTQLSCNCFDKDRNPVDCGAVEYSIAPGSSYPAEGAVSVGSASGLVTALKPGVAKIQARASGVVSSYNLSFTVAYEGDLNFSGVTNHNTYNGCGCKEDFDNPPHKWKWYVVTYTVKLHFYFWLSTNLADTPSGDLEGTNTYDYYIEEPSYCKGITFSENVNGFDFIDSANPFSVETTQKAISGDEFTIDYHYWDYRGWGYLQGIILNCKMINPGVITAHVRYYEPEGCVMRVFPQDFELK